MAVNITLAFILFLLMCIIGSDRGLISYLSLLCNLVIFILMNVAISHGINVLIVTFATCIILSLLNLFVVNGVNFKTKAAFYSILLVVGILLLLTIPIVSYSHIQGFTTEQSDSFMVYQTQIQVSYEQLTVCVVVISLIGALIDAAISIASAMYEVLTVNPSITKKELYQAGLRMGRDILSTNINTLYFAFLGGNMAFCLWLNVYQYSFDQLINYKLFVDEVLTLLINGIGCILVIPVTAGICVKTMLPDKKK